MCTATCVTCVLPHVYLHVYRRVLQARPSRGETSLTPSHHRYPALTDMPGHGPVGPHSRTPTRISGLGPVDAGPRYPRPALECPVARRLEGHGGSRHEPAWRLWRRLGRSPLAAGRIAAGCLRAALYVYCLHVGLAGPIASEQRRVPADPDPARIPARVRSRSQAAPCEVHCLLPTCVLPHAY